MAIIIKHFFSLACFNEFLLNYERFWVDAEIKYVSEVIVLVIK